MLVFSGNSDKGPTISYIVADARYNWVRSLADVVELADTQDLGSCADGVKVRVLSSAPLYGELTLAIFSVDERTLTYGSPLRGLALRAAEPFHPHQNQAVRLAFFMSYFLQFFPLIQHFFTFKDCTTLAALIRYISRTGGRHADSDSNK